MNVCYIIIIIINIIININLLVTVHWNFYALCGKGIQLFLLLTYLMPVLALTACHKGDIGSDRDLPWSAATSFSSR